MNAVAMQTVSTQRTAVVGQAVRPAVRAAAPRVCRTVRASAEESRRAVLSGLVAGVAALTIPRANAIEVIDDRKALDTGFDLIYEARDTDLPQAVRDGLDQARSDPSATKKRIQESLTRINNLSELVEKKYWTPAREELRLQVGTLRFDVNTLASKLDKASAKNVASLKNAAYKKVDEFDYALRKKDGSKAAPALSAASSALQSLVSALG